ncbi:MCM DNA helicase complex subunit [Coelomomyces lativittatus]|nr:MCM DNA helicase complex subunit [Coelomomyces lativittatus]
MERDYRSIDRLDQYRLSDIDDQEYQRMDPRQRATVEAELRRRDVMEGKLPAAFLDDQEEVDFSELQPRRRRRKYQEDNNAMDLDDEDEDVLLENIHDLKGKSIAEWIVMDRPRNTVKKEFRNFLLSYTDEQNNSVYGERIRTLCELNRESLEVSFVHLEDANAILAYMLSNSPLEMLTIFDEVAMDVVTLNFETYARIHPSIHVRITDLPITLSLRELREVHLNTLVRVTGVVTRRTGVFPQLKYVKYDCVKCGTVIGPVHQDATTEVKVQACPTCMSKGPFNLNTEQTVYRNFQKLTLQETPGTVPPGRLPRHRDVILLWDLIDAARPGEEIEVIGVYRHNFDMSLNTKHGFPVFSTILEANHLCKKDDEFAALRLTQDDVQKIKKLSKDPNLGRKLIQSIAPSIYGHDDIKTALALQLFGGVPKNVRNKHRIRGDINVLLLGDPGTAKSQFLKYIEKVSPRAVFTTGQGASAVGLTASVRKDPMSREWTLEGGALVLADKGVCLIDEFDKMNDADRTSIHEAMEQQSISISKAGIVTTLHARCAILAAANPLRGRYNTQIPFSQNVDLTEPILSRFDVLCVVKDRVDPEADERLAEFVVRSHMRSHPNANSNTTTSTTSGEKEEENGEDDMSMTTLNATTIPQPLLKKYIMYAKEKVYPKLHELDEDKISRLYSDLRRESLLTGSIPITVRHLESIIRMSEAHARMHLREYVRSDDIDMAISVMLDSFINAQKYTVMRQLRKVFNKYIRYQHEDEELLLFALNDLVRDAIRVHRYSHGELPTREVSVALESFETKARDLNIHNITSFLQSNLFRKNKFSLRTMSSNQRRCIIKVLE